MQEEQTHNASSTQPYEVIESLSDIEELEQRYEYETVVWLCKYTVHF